MEKKTDNVLLCPNCQTGKESYLLDSKSPVCPYLHFHAGQSCIKFKKIKK